MKEKSCDANFKEQAVNLWLSSAFWRLTIYLSLSLREDIDPGILGA
jgi:hypothetical protein